jgi:REP element-mobilizing transposase RayT
MNRGRARQSIFHGAGYYEDFLKTLEECHTRFDAQFHAYCLMSNHYHLLVETPRANLDRIMRHLNGVYTQRYNRRKRSDGPLFRGRYKAILVDEDAYLLQVGRYIHRNPLEVKGARKGTLNTYRHSSYLAYLNKVAAPDWLVREKMYRMLGRRDRYIGYQEFVLEGNDEETEAFYSKGNQGSIYGDKAFRQSIGEDKENLQVSSELPKALSVRPDLAEIVTAVAKVFKTSEGEIETKRVGRQRSNVARQMAMYCGQQLGDHSLKDIAEYFSLTNPGSVSHSISSMKARLEAREFRKEYRQLEELLNIIK